MTKRGLTHIEVLLSFLIFMGFVVFALYFFSPFQTSRLVDSSLDYAFREIIKNTTIEIETYSFWFDVSGYESEVKKIRIENIDSSKIVIAENKNHEVVLVKRDGAL